MSSAPVRELKSAPRFSPIAPQPSSGRQPAKQLENAAVVALRNGEGRWAVLVSGTAGHPALARLAHEVEAPKNDRDRTDRKERLNCHGNDFRGCRRKRIEQHAPAQGRLPRGAMLARL